MMGAMLGADLIRGPVGMVLGLIVWLVVFSLLIGAINGWYLQSVDAGVVSGERFDRVVGKASDDKSADDRWSKVTGTEASSRATALNPTTAYILSEGTNDACKVSDITVAAGGAPVATSTVTAYTPLGTELTANIPGVSASGSGEIAIAGCEWSDAGAVFNAGGLSGLVEIILQAAGLAPPIALLFALGTFGTSFLRNNMGSHPILAAVLTVIMLLLVATLLNTFVPFLTAAFAAIDKNRFIMYDEGLGNVSTVIANFYGVVVVASMMMIAWELVKHLKGGNVINSGQRM